MKQIEYICPEKEVIWAVDINKNSTGSKQFTSYPMGGMKKIR
jgi:hypothetical protein